MIYLDNAATTQMSESALEALMYVSKEFYGNPSSLHSQGRQANKLIEESRKIIATCIGAEPEEIYFTSGGTESDNWAIEQALRQKCERVITSSIEHHAVLNSVERMHQAGVKTEYLPVNEGCVVDANAFETTMKGQKSFVSIMFQNNETGVVQPIKKLSDIVHKDNATSIFHTDAVQAIGHIPINVKELGIDMLSGSAHKFNGPKGVGFLFVRKGNGISPLIVGGGQEYGLRSGTENVAGIYSMAKALEENVRQIEDNSAHIKKLELQLLEELKEKNIEYIINGDNDVRATGIVNISIKDIDGEGLLNMLDMHGICISIGSACNSKSKEPSHVLSAMGMQADRIEEAVRISIGRFNNRDEIELLVSVISSFYKVSHLSKQ